MGDAVVHEAEDGVTEETTEPEPTTEEAARDGAATAEEPADEDGTGPDDRDKLIAPLRQVAVAAAVEVLTPIVKDIVTRAAEAAVKRAPELLENAGGVQGLSDRARDRVEQAGGMAAFASQTRERIRRRKATGGEEQGELDENVEDPVIDVEFEEEELDDLPLGEDEERSGSSKSTSRSGSSKSSSASGSSKSSSASGSSKSARSAGT